MFDAKQPQKKRSSRGARGLAIAVTMLLTVSLSAGALAASTPTVASKSSGRLGKIAVDGQGRTLYVLTPETASHLLCKTHACFEAWPPETVSSSKAKLVAGPGVRGHLGLLRRSNGTFQVTLGGLPLYRFAGDAKHGEVNGQGIKSFGGVWHVVQAAAV